MHRRASRYSRIMQPPSGPFASGPDPASGVSSARRLPAAESGFAELLVALAAPQISDDSWNDDGLEDDVATITDERTRPYAMVPDRCSHHAASENQQPEARSRKPKPAATPKSLKTASITIRLSESECAQLRRRAAEAGLTVSAYLRSCTLEVESLRAQVKQALADMRTPGARPATPPAKAPPHEIHSIFTRPAKWIQRFIPRRHPAPEPHSAARLYPLPDC
jgi:predicted DNA binding CopG/RHH family protein